MVAILTLGRNCNEVKISGMKDIKLTLTVFNSIYLFYYFHMHMLTPLGISICT